MRSNRTISFNSWAAPELKASHVASQYMEWQTYKEKAMSRWEEIEAYIYATDTTSLPGGDVFDHTTHIPYIHELREELKSIMYSTIFPNEDFIGFQAYDAESKQKRFKALSYLKNRHTLNNLRKTGDKLISDWMDYGIAICQTQYVDKSRKAEDGTVVSGYAGPVPMRISPYDFTMDPTAPSFESAPKIIRRIMSMGEFVGLAEKQDWDSDVVQSVLDKRGTVGTVDFSDNKKNKQYTPDGFNTIESYYTSGMVELLYFYGDVFDEQEGTFHPNRCVVVVDRCKALSDTECLEPHIYCAVWKEKPDNLWGQGAFDQILGLNFQINHRENALSTSIDRFLFPDRVQMGDVEMVYDPNTGAKDYLAPEGGGVQDLVPDSTVLSYDSQIRKLMDMGRIATGLPPSLSGFRSPGEKTVFEVQALQDGAYRSFLHKAERFEMDLLEKVFLAELSIGRDNLASILQVEARKPDGVQTYLQITKEDLTVNGSILPMGARRFALQNKQMAMINSLSNSRLADIVGKHLNSYRLAEAVQSLGGLSDFDMFQQFAAIEEEFEQQQLINTAQQMNDQSLAQPTMEEAMLDEG